MNEEDEIFKRYLVSDAERQKRIAEVLAFIGEALKDVSPSQIEAWEKEHMRSKKRRPC